MAMKQNGLAKTQQKGFTLVEVLVGMAISLIAVLAIFQSFAAFEGRKKTTEASSDAQIDSAFVSTMLDREIRKAGYGFSHTTALGCATNFYNADALPKETIKRLIPALIVNGAGGTADSIQILSANNQALTPLVLSGDTDSTQGNTTSVTRKMVVKNTFGIRVGDYFVIANLPNGVSFTEPATQRCTFGQATTSTGLGSVTATNSIFNGLAIDRASGAGPCNIGDNTCDAGSKFNFTPTAAGAYTPLTYKQQVSGVIPLGSLFIQTFSVNNTGQDFVLRLTSTSPGAIATPNDVAVGVVNMQAQYGIDSNGDDVIDSWEEPVGTWVNTRLDNTTQDATEIKDIWKIKAIRMAIITRANIVQKAGECPSYGSSLSITWPSGPAMSATLPSNPAGNCYRYQVSKINVALKNVIWSAAGDL